MDNRGCAVFLDQHPLIMTPSVRSAGVYGSAATEGSATVPLPSGWQAGDLCYIGWTLLAGTPVVTLPAGWSEFVPAFVSQQNANTIFGVLRRILQAGDTAPVINSTVTGRWAAISVAVTGYHPINVEDTAATWDEGPLANFPDVRIPSITSITNNALMLAFAVSRNSTSGFPITWTPPAGMTEVTEVSATVSSIVAMELSRLDLPVPTTTGVKIATPAAGTFTGPAPMGASIVIRDAAAPNFDQLHLLQESGHALLQENRAHLLLES
jgi:hypothetical protein